jgi:hypothetical protein
MMVNMLSKKSVRRREPEKKSKKPLLLKKLRRVSMMN